MKSKSKRQIKNFILKTLLPYKKDPSICGYDKQKEECLYLTSSGNKCALGRWMKKGEWQYFDNGVECLIQEYRLNDILLKRARDMNFNIDTWDLIQEYHDEMVLKYDKDYINECVQQLEKQLGIELPELKFN